MPIDRSQVSIDIPAFADKLDAGDIVLLMRMLQRRIKRNVLPVDGLDPRHFKVLRIIHTNPKLRINMEL